MIMIFGRCNREAETRSTGAGQKVGGCFHVLAMPSGVKFPLLVVGAITRKGVEITKSVILALWTVNHIYKMTTRFFVPSLFSTKRKLEMTRNKSWCLYVFFFNGPWLLVDILLLYTVREKVVSLYMMNDVLIVCRGFLCIILMAKAGEGGFAL